MLPGHCTTQADVERAYVQSLLSSKKTRHGYAYRTPFNQMNGVESGCTNNLCVSSSEPYTGILRAELIGSATSHRLFIAVEVSPSRIIHQ
eukprot:9930204-Karenia_brevis.AAC.1